MSLQDTGNGKESKDSKFLPPVEGEYVEVYRGDYKGVRGYATAVFESTLRITTTTGVSPGKEITVPHQHVYIA